MRALVVGAASWNTIIHLDHLPDARPHTVFARESWEAVGGTSAGKALALAALGHEVHLRTVLGDDEAGGRVREALVGAGIAVDADLASGPTEQHVNLMAPDGGRLSIYRSAATPRRELDLSPVVGLAQQCDLVVVDIADHARRLVPALRTQGVPFWTDLHDWDGESAYQRDFTAADVVVMSADALSDAPRLCRRLARSRRLVVCTSGSRGATAYAGGDVVEVAAVPAHVVDTNGAGDCFAMGLAHGLQLGWTLERSLRAAAVAGATAVSSRHLVSGALTPKLLESASRVSP